MLEVFVAGLVIGFVPALILGALIGMSLYMRSGNW